MECDHNKLEDDDCQESPTASRLASAPDECWQILKPHLAGMDSHCEVIADRGHLGVCSEYEDGEWSHSATFYVPWSDYEDMSGCMGGLERLLEDLMDRLFVDTVNERIVSVIVEPVSADE